MATYTISIKDHGIDAVPGLAAFVQLTGPAFRPQGAIASMRKQVTLNSLGEGTVTLVPTAELTPSRMYTLILRYASGREIDVLDFVAQVGGGPINSPALTAAPLSMIEIGEDITTHARGVLRVDIKGNADGLAELVVEKGALV